MPRGKKGCFNCNAPTTRVVQVVDRQIVGWGKVAAREKTVNSMQRSYCTACAEIVYRQLHRLLERWHDEKHGCGVCQHGPTSHRIQLWMRRIGKLNPKTGLRKHSSLKTRPPIATCYCKACAKDIYEDAVAPLGGHKVVNRTYAQGQSYEGARAVRKKKRDALQTIHR